MLFGLDFRSIVIRVIAVILAMSVHEMAHGLVSYWFGDPTAKRNGRLSLDPLAHIDWAGLASLLLFGFGWAKPVPIDSSYYKNQRAGIIWTSFAGPAANFILAFVCLVLYALCIRFFPAFIVSTPGTFFASLFQTTAILSISFGIFNLLPIPPLDGAKIFFSFLPDDLYYRWMNGSPVFMLILFILLYTGILSGPLSQLTSAIYYFMANIASMLI